MPKHKTSGSHQALHVGLSKQIHGYMNQFISNIRNKLPCFQKPKNKEDRLFVSYNGKPLTAGDLANAITLELSGCGYQYRGNCTTFRKMTVTMVGIMLKHLAFLSDICQSKIYLTLLFMYKLCTLDKIAENILIVVKLTALIYILSDLLCSWWWATSACQVYEALRSCPSKILWFITAWDTGFEDVKSGVKIGFGTKNHGWRPEEGEAM